MDDLPETEPTTSRSRLRSILRGLLAGPLVLIGTFVVMAGAALWLPKGEAEVNHIVMPVVFLPAIWGVLFFWAYLDKKLWRAWAVVGGVILVHGGLIARHLLVGAST